MNDLSAVRIAELRQKTLEQRELILRQKASIKALRNELDKHRARSDRQNSDARKLATDRFRRSFGDLIDGESIGDLSSRFFVSLRHNYVYVSVPKVACSTIKATLSSFELGRPPYQDGREMHLREYVPLLSLTQASGFARGLLTDGSAFVFTFVRNPFTRVLSAYLSTVEPSLPQKVEIARRLGLAADRASEIDFEQFVAAIEKMPEAEMNVHWKPQSTLLLRGRIEFGFVGRYEAFDSDFGSVLDRIGCDPTRHRRDVRYHATHADDRVQEFYGGDLASRVVALYREDFERFGYSTNLPCHHGI